MNQTERSNIFTLRRINKSTGEQTYVIYGTITVFFLPAHFDVAIKCINIGTGIWLMIALSAVCLLSKFSLQQQYSSSCSSALKLHHSFKLLLHIIALTAAFITSTSELRWSHSITNDHFCYLEVAATEGAVSSHIFTCACLWLVGVGPGISHQFSLQTKLLL